MGGKGNYHRALRYLPRHPEGREARPMLSSKLLAAESSEEMDKTYYKIPVRPDPFIFIL
jgi:hypothetical protein